MVVDISWLVWLHDYLNKILILDLIPKKLNDIFFNFWVKIYSQNFLIICAKAKEYIKITQKEIEEEKNTPEVKKLRELINHPNRENREKLIEEIRIKY